MALGPFYVALKLKQNPKLSGVALFMRHGETPWNREGRVMGRSPVDLDDAGRAQVTASVALAREIAPDLIMTSPLARARQSAEIISSGIGGVPIFEDTDIEEVRYGRWEGMVFQDLVDDPDYKLYREAPITTPTPGGETIGQVQERGVRAVMRAIEANHGKRILFVSHGDIIRTVLSYFMGLGLENFRRLRVDNATFSAVHIMGDFAEVKFVNLLPDPDRAFHSPFKIKIDSQR
ncbi:MAG TPA: histidine phosphatase family protein [Candidatus Binataceae bacterium]|nr:histidine phosphatase family protein [Candidatus Binataceae bacterium]